MMRGEIAHEYFHDRSDFTPQDLFDLLTEDVLHQHA